MIINSKTRNVVYEFGEASPEAQKGPSNAPENLVDKIPAKPAKTREKAKGGRDTMASVQMATEEQKKYIRDNASDADYEKLMLEYGAEFEKMTANQAAEAIQEIDAGGDSEAPTCERCGKIITGVALPDGTLMTASELIGKSKLAYDGIYCFECAKALKAARKAG